MRGAGQPQAGDESSPRVSAAGLRITGPRWDVAAALSIDDRWWVLLAVLFVFFLEWIDRALIQVAMEPIRMELQLTDTQLGSVLAASGWIGFVSVMPTARLADRWPRRDVIAIALCIWAAGTVLSAMCSSFGTLCVARGLVGMGTASFYPASKSIIADFFPAQQRASAYGSLQAAWLVGYLSGMIGGGMLTEAIGWRLTFVFLGTPQILVAALIYLTVPTANPCSDPSSTVAPTGLLCDIAALLKLRTLRALLAGSFFLHLTGSIDKFATSFYHRVHLLSVAETSTALGITGVAPACAGLVGGVMIDKYYRRTERPSVWMATAACLVLCSIPFYIGSVLVPSVYLSLVLRAVGASVQAPHAVGLSSAQMSVVAPSLRATTAALYEVLFYLGGTLPITDSSVIVLPAGCCSSAAASRTADSGTVC
jgi:predicted MFS family arabinose efflux permease